MLIVLGVCVLWEDIYRIVHHSILGFIVYLFFGEGGEGGLVLLDPPTVVENS